MNIKEKRILFVCLGNICRSPAGEGILKHLAKRESSLNIHVESCGIGDWHIGKGPDKRIEEASKIRGIVLTSRAQLFQDAFFEDFDLILAADKEVLSVLYENARNPQQKAKLFMMTAFSSVYAGKEIPDPFYESDQAFELVLDMLEDSCMGLIEHLKE